MSGKENYVELEWQGVDKRIDDESVLQWFSYIERMRIDRIIKNSINGRMCRKLFSMSSTKEVDSMNDSFKKKTKGLNVEQARRIVDDRREWVICEEEWTPYFDKIP